LTILAGVGLWRVWPAMSIPQRVAVLSPIVFFPLVYYLVVYMPRYRVPIDWIVFMLAGAAFLPEIRGARPKRSRTAGESSDGGARHDQPGDPARFARQNQSGVHRD
jgi:hypothetical protein